MISFTRKLKIMMDKLEVKVVFRVAGDAKRLDVSYQLIT